MVTNVINEQSLFLGIDGGGSKCKATIIDENNNILGSGIAGPANPLHGYEQTINSIVESAKLALIDADLSIDLVSSLTAGVGLAGVNLPSLFEKMQQWQHPFKQMFLTTDLRIACLGAHNGEDGAIMITGTGSCGYSFVNGKETFIGGHGFPHGDKGSGAWLGLQAATTVLRSLDGLEKTTAMNTILLDKLNCSNALEIVEAIAKKPASYFAQLACVAFQAANEQDELALAIVNDGASYISNIARKLCLEGPIELSLIGGLTPVLTPYFEPEIASRLSAPTNPPEIGAIIFAKQQLAKQA
ncbi:N-acetylglucosamine kinase [Psychrobium sp. 1_MG-2023]|uniref:N-acetylglucosamine kinase n=1 Tax=Psychrobium sp. 1_MG-2023 TaxID=3062624 RepID=UPI000C328CBF|nr:BadF/BadG/BcrA/BcrD ATPase family protein [Psychrobium sp. 1_MG-2023]MDP2559535.1 BadF/BadG/BcrA/BcrD ATPase family protein [Psychrobium sp. 1_MG-2023]PKF59375.1 ATPase [Alteromonadales bacterium alter-6D02]